MSSVSKFSKVFFRAKSALFQSFASHASMFQNPGTHLVSNFHLSRIPLSSPSAAAALSTVILSTSFIATLVSENVGEHDGVKSSWISRSVEGYQLGKDRCTHCDSALLDASNFGTKDRIKTKIRTSTTGDATETISPRNADKIQRRMTSICRFSLASETIWNPSIITVVIELRNNQNQTKFTKHDFIRLWNQRNMDERHPRFHQIVDFSTRKFSGVQEFHSAHTTDIAHHVSESILPMNRQSLQKLIQNMQLKQWDLSDSLWHLTVCNSVDKSVGDISGPKDILSPTLLLFRGHHVLADGASMSAAFADLYDESDVLRAQIADFVKTYRRQNRRSRSLLKRLWKLLLNAFNFCLGSVLSIWYILRLFFLQTFIDDHPWRYIKKEYYSKKNTGKNGESALDVARVISWTDVASIEQVKWVAETLSQWNHDNGEKNKFKARKISVNDVFIACVTAAMAKQLDFHRQRLSRSSTSSEQVVLSKQNYIHVAVPVHLKGGVVLPDESVGNNIGALVVRVPSEMENCGSEKDGCEGRLHSVGAFVMDVPIICCLQRWIDGCDNRGPSIPVHLDGHLVESVYGFVPLPPGVPVGVAVMSYAGRISCTLSAEPWAIPDADQFMIWVMEEYLHLVNAAKDKESLQSA